MSDNIAGIVNDAEPVVVRAVGDGLFLGPWIGKDEVMVTPILGDAPPLANPILAVMLQDLIQRRGRLLLRIVGLPE
ncbi:MAG: hypothetical protein WBV69_17735 [Candidatus Sulfotelmatobacter sp.]